MTDHKPECPMLDEQWPKHPLEKCPYCDMLRACEQRVLDAAEQAIRDALSGDGRNLYAELTALAAIDALRKDQR